MRNLMRRAAGAFFLTAPGRWLIERLIDATQHRVFSPRTARLMRFDAMRLAARASTHHRTLRPTSNKLHLGCGGKHLPGWENADVIGSPVRVDLAAGRLPWPDGSFDAVVSEHVVEHLDLRTQLVPLLRELRRISRPGATWYLSCPDLRGVCESYVRHRAADLLAWRRQRVGWGDVSWLDRLPPQQWINEVFHQQGDHQNLLDLDLLRWALAEAGVEDVQQVPGRLIAEAFPGFPARGDEPGAITVRARVHAAARAAA